MTNSPTFRALDPSDVDRLAHFFETIANDPSSRHFHPHPFTRNEAIHRCEYDGADFYAIAMSSAGIIAYGMLRGWDEGYTTPSLGIGLHPDVRQTGLARAFMHYLHFCARLRGATDVRLTVYRDNERAIHLYRSLGYQYADTNGSQLIGRLQLNA